MVACFKPAPQLTVDVLIGVQDALGACTESKRQKGPLRLSIRLSPAAIALIPLTLWFVVAIIKITGAGHSDAISWVQSPFNAIMLLLLIVATFYHMQLGLQVVIEDYVHSEVTKTTLMLAQKLTSFALGVAAGFAVLKIAFGG